MSRPSSRIARRTARRIDQGALSTNQVIHQRSLTLSASPAEFTILDATAIGREPGSRSLGTVESGGAAKTTNSPGKVRSRTSSRQRAGARVRTMGETWDQAERVVDHERRRHRVRRQIFPGTGT